MKIDGNAPNAQPVAPRVEESGQRSAGAAAAANAAHGDTVQLSPQARLAGRALQAASAAPKIDPDKVERARQKLAAGEIGTDAARLADRIIDHVLEG